MTKALLGVMLGFGVKDVLVRLKGLGVKVSLIRVKAFKG